MTTISSQFYPFAYSLSSGIIIALLYDIFRIKRKVFGTNKISIILEDFLYWLLAGVVIFVTTFYGCHGVLRGYIFIGIIFGVIIYIIILSKSIMKTGIFLLKSLLRPIFFINNKLKGFFRKAVE